MDTGLARRVVLVTGASGGIGQEVVRACAAESARVVAHFRRQAEPAQALARQLGPDCVALGADLSREDEVDRLFNQAEAALGPVEVLVANAGSWPSEPVPLHALTLARWNATL